MAIKTRIIKQPKLTWWEQIYFPEVIRGLWITSTHFFRNLLFHFLHTFGLFKQFRAAVTIMYPERMRPITHRSRTRHRLVRREDDTPRCVACMMCETVCPAKCIYIVADEHPDPNVEKRPKRFDLDLGKCVYCGFCVEACPEDAIRMDTKIINTASYSREAMYLTMDRLLYPEKEGAVVLGKPPLQDKNYL